MVRGSANFDLARCVKAANEGYVDLGRKRCRDVLESLLGEVSACERFARAVISALTPNNFNGPVTLPSGQKCDEYGIQLPSDFLNEFGLTEETWYVKFWLTEGSFGDETYCISLHPLELPMDCVGGRIEPSKRRDWS